ncbi:MAG TPA: AMP-binding protein, partial [Tepidiformaceae bacterium]|nr:AMP-binding protein [Tepidiformaceae bacterium]
MNTVEFLQISSAVVPDREALVEVGGNGKRLSYEEMARQTTRLANAMSALGIKQGEKVAAMSVNSAEYVITYYACAALGVTFVPLNYRSKEEELTHMVNVSSCVAVFVSDRYADLLDKIRPSLTGTRNFISYDGPKPNYLDYSELIANASEDDVYTEIDDHDPTILIFTSGTTALPKGVVLTYMDLTVYVTNTMSPADPEIHDKTLASVPFFHIAGATALMSSIWGGRTLVILPAFTPEL